MKFHKIILLNVVLALILSLLIVPAYASQKNKHRDDHNIVTNISRNPDVSGCINVKGRPLANIKVIMEQRGEHRQKTRTDYYGCYEFRTAVPGKKFTVTVEGNKMPYITPATRNVRIAANLDSRETIPSQFDANNPDDTSNFSASFTVFDSVGDFHVLNMYFRKSDETPSGNTWEWFVVVIGIDSASGNTEIQAQGTLDFDNNGALMEESAIFYPAGGFDFEGGVEQDQVITFDFGISTNEGGTGYDGVTQFGAASSVSFLWID